MTTHTGTFAPAADGRGRIELDDAPNLPAGRRVRVTVEPADAAQDSDDPHPARPPAAPTIDPPAEGAGAEARSGFERSFGIFRDHAEELDAFIEETYRLRRLTREEARQLRGE